MGKEFDPAAWDNDEYDSLTPSQNEQIRRYYSRDYGDEETNPQLKTKWKILRKKFFTLFDAIPYNSPQQNWQKTNTLRDALVELHIFTITHTPDAPFVFEGIEGSVRNVQVSLIRDGDPDGTDYADCERSIRIDVDTAEKSFFYKLRIATPKTNPHGSENEFIPYVDDPAVEPISYDSATQLLDHLIKI